MNAKISVCVLLISLIAPLPSQGTRTKSPAWPKISKRERQRVKFQLRQLKAKDKDSGEVDVQRVAQAEAALIAMGAGVTLELLRRLDDGDQDESDAIKRVLDSVLAPEHCPLLARLVRRKEPEVRRYVVTRLARFHRPEMEPVFQEALKDRDADVVFLAALGLGGLGEFEAMQTVFDRCRRGWPEYGGLVSEVLGPVRSKKAAQWVFARIKTDDTSGWVAGLRLLRSLAPKSFKHELQAALNSEQSSVKKAAINALRVVIDGDPPLEKLTVFQAIELAKQWRQR